MPVAMPPPLAPMLGPQDTTVSLRRPREEERMTIRAGDQQTSQPSVVASQYPSKFWGELRHGDYITVWLNDQDNTKFTQFRFECFWGNSRQERYEEEEFKVLEDGELLNEIERTCLAQEKGILVNRARREEEKEAIQKGA
ncbi:hypothetical protein DL98DRAFT_607621 [Cadophora sp. DSE1049]|nr:hypothetical protein DL98DRAFT_607621 [Cadophora sp. DSE1049]